MPSPRLVATKAIDTGVLLYTYQKDDRSAQGVWARPAGDVLIFADNTLDGSSFSYHGGATAGAPGGHPVQLVFWGSWWTNAGASARGAIEAATVAMLDSPYFDHLAQYGIARPLWRGSLIATEPGPPMSVADIKEIGRATVDLIDDLIDDDVFPDPDEGPRIIYIVVMPDGFVLRSGDALGAHRSGYDWDFIFDEPDEDRFWAGWIAPNADRQEMMWVMSHEIAEMLTDPESDGWHTENDTATNEVSDAGFSGGTAAAPGTQQTAFVNGCRVQSYWSNTHRATIIPMDHDYKARLRVRVHELRRQPLADGTFRLEADDQVGCPEFAACCLEDREYAWRVYGLDERARITLDTQRYAIPVSIWRINATPVSGSGTITLHLDVETFAGRTASTANRPVTLRFDARADRLDIFADNPGGNFDVVVTCSVRDGSITGNVATDIVCSPSIVVGFACAELQLENAYNRQKEACLRAMLDKYVVQYKPMGRIRPEEGINWDPRRLLQDIPAHLGPTGYAGLRWLADAGRAAGAVLPPERAARFQRKLANDATVLARNITVPARGRRHRPQ